MAKPDRFDALSAAMMQEYRSGYVLERFFWDELAHYERSPGDLRGFIPGMLARLDAVAELRRWRTEKDVMERTGGDAARDPGDPVKP